MPAKNKRPLMHKLKKRISFLNLPGEVRNQVYSHHYDTTRLVELVPTKANYVIPDAHNFSVADFLRFRDHEVPVQGIRCGKMLGKYNRVGGMKTRWHLSVSGLHVANKQIHHECVALLYASIAIFAQSSNRLVNFLTVVPYAKLKFIQRLHLDHQTYGSPADYDSEVWKSKHQGKWTSTCAMAARFLPGIQELRINISVLDQPLRFTLKEAWVKPVLGFIRLKQLKNVQVKVFSPEIEKTRINVHDGKKWAPYQPWYVRMLVNQHGAAAEAHDLFGKAIALKIQGYCDDCALEAYKKDCEVISRFLTYPSMMETQWMQLANTHVEEKCTRNTNHNCGNGNYIAKSHGESSLYV